MSNTDSTGTQDSANDPSFKLFELVLPNEEGEFSRWIRGLPQSDYQTVRARLHQVTAINNLGKMKELGGELCEMKLDTRHGAKRVYFVDYEGTKIVLLFGGDKSSRDAQNADIDWARKKWKGYKKWLELQAEKPEYARKNRLDKWDARVRYFAEGNEYAGGSDLVRFVPPVRNR